MARNKGAKRGTVRLRIPKNLVEEYAQIPTTKEDEAKLRAFLCTVPPVKGKGPKGGSTK